MFKYIRRKIKFVVIAGAVLSPVLLLSQYRTSQEHRTTRNVAWFTPCGAEKINGLAIGLQAMPIKGNKLVINGINADAGFAGMIGTMYAIGLSFKKEQPDNFLIADSAGTIIKGISISMGGEIDVSVTGLNIAGGLTAGKSLKGISVTGLFTKIESFHGVCISGVHNKAIKGKGIQIGLFNNCKELKGLQLGLWNKSGKRGLPFINWGI